MSEITTRYRDIPFEEALKCAPNTNESGAREIWEEQLRGHEVIFYPLTRHEHNSYFTCEGPFFKTANGGSCCPHIAEIGD